MVLILVPTTTQIEFLSVRVQCDIIIILFIYLTYS
jgi:hypothetical protein